MKIEETFKKLQEIYSQTQYIIHSSNTELSKEVLNHLIQDMKQVRDGVMDVERLLMEDLQFDVEIIAPHRFESRLIIGIEML